MMAGLLTAVLGWALGEALAQGGPESLMTVRVASVSQWVVNQHGGAAPGLVSALDAGVQERVVFWWRPGRIHRDSLALKAIRLLAGDEARSLGARGAARLVRLEYPRGPSAWSVATLGAVEAGSRAVIELGGEQNTVRQVLDTLLVVQPDGRLAKVPLSRRAMVAGAGVPVVQRPPGPLAPDLPFGAAPGGLELLVVRSTVEAVPDGAVSPGGVADASPHPGNGTGDWREADRVLIRVPVGTTSGSVPSLVLGWKDRVLRPDPDAEFPVQGRIPARPAGAGPSPSSDRTATVRR